MSRPIPRLPSLRSLRVGAGLSQEALARRANVSLAAIQREEDAVARGLSGGGNLEHAEQARIATALSTAIGTLRA